MPLHHRTPSPDEQPPIAFGGDPVAEILTAGYGRVLELEAERTRLGREIDAQLIDGDEALVLALVTRQRDLGVEITAQRRALDDLSARRRRPPRPAAPPPPGP